MPIGNTEANLKSAIEGETYEYTEMYPGFAKTARDEGLQEVEQIISQYETELPLPRDEIRKYLTENITFELDESLKQGMRLYFELAHKHGLIENNKPLAFITT